MPFSYLTQLGLAGTVFIVLMALLQLGLTQFVKTTLKRWGANIQGGVILVISLLVGALLGWVMLSKAARLLDITLAEPWAGIVAGMILAATVSGLVSYQQQRTAEAQAGTVTSDVLAGILAQVQATQQQPSVNVHVPPPVVVPAQPAPAAPPLQTEWLEPITAQDLQGAALLMDEQF